MQSDVKRLVLGTVQFGLAYGVANRTGQVTREAAVQLLDTAHAAGIDTLDTAVAYGSSESVLGQIGVDAWRIISKLPPLPSDVDDVEAWVRKTIGESLQRLRVPQLHGLLLHRPTDLLESRGALLYQAMLQFKSLGVVSKVGVSIYDPQELDSLVRDFRFDIVQAPFNVLDRRLEATGWLDRLKEDGIEVHTRSAFLQGLLLMPADARTAYFERWQSLWGRWHQWLAQSGSTAVQACLGFVLSRARIDRVVVGVDSLSQLREMLATTAGVVALPPDEIVSFDTDLLNPSKWLT